MDGEEDPPDRGPPPDDYDVIMTGTSTNTSMPQKRVRDNEVHPGPSKAKKTSTDSNLPAASVLTTFIHPMLSDENKAYSESDSGPFIVHVQKEEESNSGFSIRPIKFGQLLFKNNIKNIARDGIKKIGRNRVSVEFTSARDANNFVKNPLLKHDNYKANIPTYNFSRMGLVRGIPTDIGMDEFVDSTVVPSGYGIILKSRRLNRKVIDEGKPQWIPTGTVVLTFQGQKLPERIFAFNSALFVDTYIMPTIQCFKCVRFGHVQTQCRSSPRCYKCAQPHAGDQCPVVEDKATCLFCSGSHYATNKKCPEHIRQQNIKSVMSCNNLSYAEASRKFPSSRKSYAEVSASPLPTSYAHRPTQRSPNNPSPTPTQSYKKTILRSPRPRASIEPGFDQTAHNAIISTPQSSYPNGHALPYSIPSGYVHSPPSGENLFSSLVDLLLNLLNKSSDSLPSDVALKILQTADSIKLHSNGDPTGDPME